MDSNEGVLCVHKNSKLDDDYVCDTVGIVQFNISTDRSNHVELHDLSLSNTTMIVKMSSYMIFSPRHQRLHLYGLNVTVITYTTCKQVDTSVMKH